MERQLEKLADLEYNEIIVLGVIESDEDLTSIFREEVTISFNLLKSIAKENKLNETTKNLLSAIFNSVILTKIEYVNKYKRLSSMPESNEEIIKTEVIVESIVTEVPKSTVKVTKILKEKELPRRYGKVLILKDIEAQGGKATPVQRAMLKVNDLKNIYVSLSARGIKDMVGGTNLLTDVDCRDIVSVITIAERKLADILKKK